MNDYKIIRAAKDTVIYGTGGVRKVSKYHILGIVPFSWNEILFSASESNNLKKTYQIQEKGVFIAVPLYFLNNKNGNIYDEGTIINIVNISDVYIENINKLFFRGSLLGKVVKGKKETVKLYKYSTDKNHFSERKSNPLFYKAVLGDLTGEYRADFKRFGMLDKNNAFFWVSIEDIVMQERNTQFSADRFINAFNKHFVKPLAEVHEQASQLFTENIQKPLLNAAKTVKNGLGTVKIIAFSAGLFLLLFKANKK